MLCCVVLYCIVLCCIVLCCVVLYCIVFTCFFFCMLLSEKALPYFYIIARTRINRRIGWEGVRDAGEVRGGEGGGGGGGVGEGMLACKAMQEVE